MSQQPPVAAQLQVTNCKSCEAQIVWMKTRKFKNIPVDYSSITENNLWFVKLPSGVRRPQFNANQGLVPHFQTCPNADDHRRTRQ